MTTQQVIDQVTRTEAFPFAEYATMKTPLLQYATQDQRPANSTTIEWLTDVYTEPQKNHTQIVRTPFLGGERDKWAALERHLKTVEDILWFGKPSRSFDGSYPLVTCGGVLHYLRREPLYADVIRLRPLQDLVLLYDRGPDGKHEFLSEFSLEVIAAPKIRRP
jgi:hypothetical protein